MEPRYKIVIPRPEVCAGRSFNPDAFASALEQVVAGTVPEDYRDPVQFFAYTCWTCALRDHCAIALRRLAGFTDQTAPVLTLITQFGGGKTHTLTALHHPCHRSEGARLSARALRGALPVSPGDPLGLPAHVAGAAAAPADARYAGDAGAVDCLGGPRRLPERPARTAPSV